MEKYVRLIYEIIKSYKKQLTIVISPCALRPQPSALRPSPSALRPQPSTLRL
jgi:hypothetical protein